MNNKELDSNGQATSSQMNSPAMGQSHHHFGFGSNYMSANREMQSKDLVNNLKARGGSGSKDASAFSKALRTYKA